MELLICQACGFIIRGKGKFCTGCGATVSKFSTTAVQTMSQTAPPLRIPAIPDPQVLEQAITARQLAEFNGGGGNGNGNGNGNGGNGAQRTMTPWRVEGPAANSPPIDSAPAQPSAPAAPAPTSKLGSILGGATSAAPFSRASAASDFLAFDDNNGAVDPSPAQAPEPSPAAPGAQAPPGFNLPADPFGLTSPAPQPENSQPATAPATPANPLFAQGPDLFSAPANNPPMPASPFAPAAADPSSATAQFSASFSTPDPAPVAPSGVFASPAFAAPEAAAAAAAPFAVPENPAASPAPPAFVSPDLLSAAPTAPAFIPSAPSFMPATPSPPTDFTPAAAPSEFAAPPSPPSGFGSASPADFAAASYAAMEFAAAPAPAPDFASPPSAPQPWAAPAAPADPAPQAVPPAPPSQFDTGGMPAVAPPSPPSQFTTGSMPAVAPPSPPSQFTTGSMPAVAPPSAPSQFTTGSMPAVAAPSAPSEPTPANDLPPFAPAPEPAVSSSPFASDAGTAAQTQSGDGFFTGGAPQAPPPGAPLETSILERQSSTGEFQAAPAAQAASSFDFFAAPAGATPSAGAEPVQPAPVAQAEAPAPAPQAPAAADFFAAAPAAPSSAGMFDFPTVPPATPAADAPQAVPSQTEDLFSTSLPTRPGQQAASTNADDGLFPDESAYRDRRKADRRKQSQEAEAQETEKAETKQTRSRKLRDIDEEDDDKKAEEKPSPMQGALAFLDGDVEIVGQTIPKKFAAIGAVVVLFIGFQLFSFAGKMLGGVMGGVGQPAQIPTIAGMWNLTYEYNGRPIQGQLRLLQQGSQLSGEGRDEAYFVVSGTFDPPKIEFNKQYADPNNPNEPLGKPILYSGTVSVYRGNKPPDASGIYIAYIKQGHFYKAYLKEIRGRWDMECIQPGAQGGAQGGAMPGPARQGTSDVKGFTDTLTKVAIGLLVVGLFVVLGSLKLFGPSGLVNIWSKKEFIPSQFKSQHFKMMKELGKGLRPGGMPLGQRLDWNFMQFDKPRSLAISPDIRKANPHMLVLGAGAKGKTRLLANFITHDIISGDRAVVVIDSDGILIDLVMRWIGHHPKAKQLSKRITIIDPTHKEGCPAYNPLQLPDDGDLQAAASAVVFGFKAIYTEPPGSQSQWNQQTANILRNAALLLMANDRTLIDLPTLLADNDFRDILLEKIEKRKGERAEFITLLDQWGQYKKLARTDQWITWVEPILNRVQPMLGDPRIRPILTKSKGDLNLKELIAESKVLLVKIPQGQLDQNANLLGSLIVTGVKQAALSISNAKSKNHPTALYLDEFDNFIEKETVDAITSETKKFQIGLVNCIKTLQHLPEDFRNQLTINVGWICAFALAKKDGDMLGPQMFRVDGRKVKHQTIQNIFNRVNTSPQFELISDEEKLNIDRVVGQEERTYFAYRVGTVAGVFHLKAPEFKDIDDKDVKWDIVDAIRERSAAEET